MMLKHRKNSKFSHCWCSLSGSRLKHSEQHLTGGAKRRRCDFSFGAPLLMITLLLCTGFTYAAPAPVTRIYAIIVANNVGLNGETPLSYADNDGAKYFELLQAAGAQVTLLTVMDERAKAIFPKAAASAVAPTRQNLDAAIASTFQLIAADAATGAETHFVFIYSGHGGIGPNREGYISLLRERFTRGDLFHQLLGPSPATYNHLVLDACNAYYFVNKRGEHVAAEGDYTDAVRRFLTSEDLQQYPNTGVMLASSVESETHEWSDWEAGVFSHELRSALLGSADIDGDGVVTYQEAAACVEAANAAVTQPKARLKVYYQSPAIDASIPLLGIQHIRSAETLAFPASMAGRYYVEDANGVRVMDLHYSTEQSLRVALLGTPPFFIRTETREAILQPGETMGDLGHLAFVERSMHSRGSVAQSFRKFLFTIPFGKGFYQGAIATGSGMLLTGRQSDVNASPVAAKQALPAETAAPDAVGEPTTDDSSRLVVAKMSPHDTPSRKSNLKTAGWIVFGIGVAAGMGGGILYGAAARNHDRFIETTDAALEDEYKTTSQRQLTASRGMFVGAGVLVATGVWMVVAHYRKVNGTSPAAASSSLSLQPLALRLQF